MMTGMTDRAIGVNGVVAWLLWTLAAVLLLVSWILWEGDAARHLGKTALFVGAAAVTATVRCYFVCTNRMVRSVLAVRDSEPSDLRSIR